MRIRQLDLLRYGHFTDAVILLPPRNPDLHIVVGDNEAGKSTAMAGFEDLLFGIPPNSPRNFVHAYNAMRIGATLEKGGETWNVRRRKGRNDTLLSEDDSPLPAGDGALAPYLAGADRTFYTRMFSLDHSRLRVGGKEIVQAQGDVGQMLFAASAGIMGLRDTLKAMEADADALWAVRRAAHRKYFQAEDRLKSTEIALREHAVPTSKWQLLRTEFEKAGAAYHVLEQEIEAKSAELRKLARIRRVCRDVKALAGTETALAAMGDVIPLALDAAETLERACRAEADAASRIAVLKDQIAALEAECNALTFDQALLARTDDIEQLRDRRIQVRSGKTDLPKRRAELASAETTLRRLSTELEWAGDIDDLIARIPARAKVAPLRALLNRRGEQMAAVANAGDGVREAEDKLAEIAEQIQALGAPADASRLAATLKATRAVGDIFGQIANCRREEEGLRAAIERALRALRPAVADYESLDAAPVPAIESVEAHHAASRDLERRANTCRERIRAATQELTRHHKAYERITSGGEVVAPEDLKRLRRHRDAGWSIIRRRYMDGEQVPDEEASAFAATHALPEAFEAAVRDADDAADCRFEKSEASAQLVLIERQINEASELLDALHVEEKALAEEGTALDAAWTDLWNAANLVPHDPEAMTKWLGARGEILDLATKLVVAEQQTATWEEREREARFLILGELDALGVPPASFADQPLHVLLESAAASERTIESATKTRRELEASQRKSNVERIRKRTALEVAEAEWQKWSVQWAEALEALRLPATSSPETAEAQLNAIEEMRDAAGRIADLRHERIEKIERDIGAFERDVAALAKDVAPHIAAYEAEDVVLDLCKMLAEAIRIRDAALEKEAALGSLQKKIEECQEASRDARDVIAHLQALAAVENIDALRAAVRRSDDCRRLQGELVRLTDALLKDGDGLSIAALAEECTAADLDALAAKEQTLMQDVVELRERLMEAREKRSHACREFEGIGGDDRAARDAADRQAALAEIREIAAQYVRLRSAIVLLRWAIERYRREKQAPMLKRAGELFTVLTGGSFETLSLEFGDDDAVELAGIRQDGKRVGVAGMSDGTVDQLYLALRVAAVEDYLDHAAPLPFIADDLFINFDDRRAAAGIRVLNELAKKTQVLFFTHHEHLVELAESAIGATVSAVRLPGIVTKAAQFQTAAA